MRKINLLPCPFCGGSAAWNEGEQKVKYGNEQIYCVSCFASTAPEMNKITAAARWNRRTGTEETSRATLTERKILTRVSTALSNGKRVTVDGILIKGIRFRDSEIEVEWDAHGEVSKDLSWIVIQPNYLHEFDDGELELKTY